ncbi:hypothetical protein T459_19655 [Capsicum annuum]|uniref:Uncharacterized protein n=1 Tax=Capsicum annuum TaxID=4072 RepID=A0A2G2Z2D6_CAPAN|nr:hypothetical protein T459_19655 [Capsicum annuum]
MDPMSSATDNAVELKRNLSISYNRERQGKITVEILEIVCAKDLIVWFYSFTLQLLLVKLVQLVYVIVQELEGFISLEYENGEKNSLFLRSTKRCIERKSRMAQEEIGWNRVLGLHIIEEWSQTQPTSEDGTMVKPSPAEMNNMWTSMVGGPKKGRICGTGVLQSSSTLLLFPSSSSTLRTVEEMEAMKKQIVELMQKCAANDARFAKFDKFEELVKNHMSQLFNDEEDNEFDDN